MSKSAVRKSRLILGGSRWCRRVPPPPTFHHMADKIIKVWRNYYFYDYDYVSVVHGGCAGEPRVVNRLLTKACVIMCICMEGRLWLGWKRNTELKYAAAAENLGTKMIWPARVYSVTSVASGCLAGIICWKNRRWSYVGWGSARYSSVKQACAYDVTFILCSWCGQCWWWCSVISVGWAVRSAWGREPLLLANERKRSFCATRNLCNEAHFNWIVGVANQPTSVYILGCEVPGSGSDISSGVTRSIWFSSLNPVYTSKTTLNHRQIAHKYTRKINRILSLDSLSSLLIKHHYTYKYYCIT